MNVVFNFFFGFLYTIRRLLFPGVVCRFYPSCSQYIFFSIKKHGFLKGGFYGLIRMLRCNPLDKGGVDVVK